MDCGFTKADKAPQFRLAFSESCALPYTLLDAQLRERIHPLLFHEFVVNGKNQENRCQRNGCASPKLKAHSS
jgi:hypothetical protein